MRDFNRKAHWERIYKTKSLNEVSWFQPKPETSLQLINDMKIAKTARIIDVGGGDSFLVDHLLELGYQDISVLDISASAIERAKTRLGSKASKVKWIISDASAFEPTEVYDLWHDRAAFHFLTSDDEISTYCKTAQQSIRPNGHLIVGTFSENGPKKCSGIEIKQYTEEELTKQFESFGFTKVNGFTIDHKTPFDTLQNFVFCSFTKNS